MLHFLPRAMLGAAVRSLRCSRAGPVARLSTLASSKSNQTTCRASAKWLAAAAAAVATATAAGYEINATAACKAAKKDDDIYTPGQAIGEGLKSEVS
jgi:hypothetical protein